MSASSAISASTPAAHHHFDQVVIVGADLTTRSGIASVVKIHHAEHLAQAPGFALQLVKTTYYKDGGRLDNLVLAARASLRFVGLLARERRTIVHIHSSFGISFYRKSIFWLVAKLLRRPVVFHLHSSQFDRFFIEARGVRAVGIRLVLGRSDRVIVLCDDWKRKLEQRYPGLEPRVLHNPIVERHPRRPHSAAGPLRVLFMGFFIESKGIRDLIGTAVALASQGVDFRLAIAGKGELAPWIVEAVERHGLAHRVTLAGWVEGADKAQMFRESDVLFLPSYHEGMPMVILEALSFGLPVVSTAISGIPDTVVDGYNGFLARPGEIMVFVERLARLAADRDLLERMSCNGYDHAERFLSGPVYRELCTEYDALGAATF